LKKQVNRLGDSERVRVEARLAELLKEDS
jgi:hypothetical protein